MLTKEFRAILNTVTVSVDIGRTAAITVLRSTINCAISSTMSVSCSLVKLSTLSTSEVRSARKVKYAVIKWGSFST